MSDDLIIRTGDAGSYLTVELAGDLDTNSSAAMTAEFKAVLGPRPVLVDLTKVEFLDSAGLGVLVGAHREAATLGGALLLVAAGPRLEKIFKITKLHKMFALYETMDEAVDSLAAPLEVEDAPVETVVPGFRSGGQLIQDWNEQQPQGVVRTLRRAEMGGAKK